MAKTKKLFAAALWLLAASGWAAQTGKLGEPIAVTFSAPSAIESPAVPVLPPSLTGTPVLPPALAAPPSISLPTPLSVPRAPEAAPASRGTVPAAAQKGLRAIGGQLSAGEAEHAAALDRAWDLSSPREAAPLAPVQSQEIPAPRAAPATADLGRAAIQDLLVRGLPSGTARVVEGEILFWDPKRQNMDPYLASPHDDKNMVSAKTRNEIEGLRRVWLDVRGALAGKVSPDTLVEADALVAKAKDEIESNRLRAEIIIERLAARITADPSRSMGQTAAILEKELVPALKSRPSLLYLADAAANMDLEKFHDDLKRLEKDLIMTKIHDRFLRLLYGFDAKTPEDVFGERLIAQMRRMAIGEFFPLINREVSAGKTAEQALNAALAKIRSQIEVFRTQVLQNPKNQLAKRNFATLEEIAAAMEAVRDSLRVYDYTYEQTDLPEVAQSKKESEYARHEEAWGQAQSRLQGQAPSTELSAFLDEIQTYLRSEILTFGRPLQYAAAGFFSRNAGRLQKVNGKFADQGLEGPLDFLMAYSHFARGGGKQAAQTRELVVMTREIRDEADYQDLRLDFREHGRIVGIVTTGSAENGGASRMPHWVIFAKADGIVPVPWAGLDTQGLPLADLAKRFERPGGRPGSALINGRRGHLLINPTAKNHADWTARGQAYGRLEEHYKSRARKPVAFNGAPVRFLADEAKPAAFQGEGPSAIEASGASGVGLLRMEQFMSEVGVEWDRAQLAAGLKTILQRPLFKNGAPLVVRLFDFEGDKIPKFVRRVEARALLQTHSNARFYLDEGRPEFREFGKMQLKALFDAHMSARPGGNVRVLFSNVRSAKEIRSIEKLVDEAAAEYAAETEDPEAAARELQRLPIGYMIEDLETVKTLGSFMAQIRRLRQERPAERFLALGTNDYQSSLLRDDPVAIEKLAKLHPRLVEGIWKAAKAAAAQGIEFTVDGEWGSDPRMLIALLALRSFHDAQATPVVYPGRAPELSEIVRNLTNKDLTMAADDAKESLKSLLDRLGSGKRPPGLEEFDAAAAAVAERVEDRILAGLASDPDQKP